MTWSAIPTTRTTYAIAFRTVSVTRHLSFVTPVSPPGLAEDGCGLLARHCSLVTGNWSLLTYPAARQAGGHGDDGALEEEFLLAGQGGHAVLAADRHLRIGRAGLAREFEH